MDFALSDAQREYRDRARTVAQERLLPGYQERERAGRIDPELRRAIGLLGLIAPELPVEFGGRGASLMEQLIWYEEYARAGAPEITTTFVGLNHAGPTLIACGTDAQKAYHLPRILRSSPRDEARRISGRPLPAVPGRRRVGHRPTGGQTPCGVCGTAAHTSQT